MLVRTKNERHTYLSGGPFKDDRSTDAGEYFVKELDSVRLRRHQGGVDIQAVSHGVVAPWVQ